jgi:hypothetical protein
VPTTQKLPFTDDFSLTGDGLQLTTNWNDQEGNIMVVNGAATGVRAFNISTVNGLSIGDSKVKADMVVPSGGSASLVARYAGPVANNFYLGQLRDVGGGQLQAAIFKNIGGQDTTIAIGTTTAVATTTPTTLEFEVVGSSLKLIFNNVLLAFGFDASLTAAGSAGMRLSQGATANKFFADKVVLPTSQNPTSPYFTDDFKNPGDGNQLSTSWSDQNGNISIDTTNHLAFGVGDFNLSTVNGISLADITVEGDVNLGSGQSVSLVARYMGPLYSNFYLAQFRDIGGGQFQGAIFKNIGGATSLVAVGITINSKSGRLKFSLVGSALELDLDTTVLAKVNDSSITGPGSVGMRLTTKATLGNFSAQ